MAINTPRGVECPDMTTAVLYIPPDANFGEFNDRLQRYCAAKNYQIVGVDRDGKPWWETLLNARRMGVDVVLVADETHLPTDRTPRVEIADLTLQRPDLPGNRQDHVRRRKPRG